ncbi:ABC transporter permease [Paenibacillus nasutitermitis]|uniref:Sugar ABC transporter permease n=1 Tax=Paenibacillus nasutitermitis TaxID=1652958 RepID=A0A917DN05_9BACL|nr:ABC transporter permease subunit [Paenibacillus nasutitermitis]GGD52435.1 sugar ABC transporter permease [Paenibacillus nasutitermitis]
MPAAVELAQQPVRKQRKQSKKIFSLYLLLAPAIVLLFVFHYLPMYGVLISFQDFSVFKGIGGSDWVGLKNFSYFLNDDTFWKIMRNTLIFNFYDIIFGFTAPIIFAILANELYSITFKRIMQTVSYLPHFLSWIVVSGIAYEILSPSHGMVNDALNALFGTKPIFFMTDPQLYRGINVAIEVWKSTGWSAILYFATIAGIDQSLYEAAKIDGANRFKQIIYITLPMMVPIIVLLFLLKISTIFTASFDRFYLLENPLVYDVGDVISTYIYRIGLEKAQYSLTTAIGFVQSLLGFIMLVAANKISKKLVGLGLY